MSGHCLYFSFNKYCTEFHVVIMGAELWNRRQPTGRRWRSAIAVVGPGQAQVKILTLWRSLGVLFHLIHFIYLATITLITWSRLFIVLSVKPKLETHFKNKDMTRYRLALGYLNITFIKNNNNKNFLNTVKISVKSDLTNSCPKNLKHKV